MILNVRVISTNIKRKKKILKIAWHDLINVCNFRDKMHSILCEKSRLFKTNGAIELLQLPCM